MLPPVAPGAAPSDRETLESIRRHMTPGSALAFRLTGGTATEVSAEGARVTLSTGRTLVDFGSYGAALLGHRHPHVVDAVMGALQTMPLSTRVLPNRTTAGLASALVQRLSPTRLPRVWFGSDGADAVEVALKLARLVTGRPRILAADGAFHGKTLGALATTWNALYRRGLEEVLPPTTHLPHDPDAVAAQVRVGDVAALIVEPIQGEGGARPIPATTLHRWVDDARAHDVVVVVDEVQVGLRRCGPWSLGLALGLDPDAVLLGKALGGGVVPLSAMVASERLFAPLRTDPLLHTSTFSGHPLSCAAALATLDVLDTMAERIDELAGTLSAALAGLWREFPQVISEVRGQGLLWGLVFHSTEAAADALLGLPAHGVLVSPCLSDPAVLRLLPPVVATDDDVGVVTGALEAVCAEIAADRPPRAS
jgi:putrescine aminotransferase